MEYRVQGLKFRYAGQGVADASEIQRILQETPFFADRIDTNGPYARVHFSESVPDSPELDRFIKLMDKYSYRLGVNNES